MEVFSVNIDSIHLDPSNVRRHPARNIDAIKASLARFGQQRPILIDVRGVVRAGNGTVEAARALGWSEIRAVRTGLKGSEATAYAIADNRTAELAEWEDVGLASTLQALRADDIDLDDIGFSPEEIDELLDRVADASDDEDSAEDPGAQVDRANELLAKWGCAVGQLWSIGEHRLLIGDTLDRDALGRLIGDDAPKLLVTSPPYNQKIEFMQGSGMYADSGWHAKLRNIGYEDSLPEDRYQEQQRDVLRIWHDHLAGSASVFYNHKNRYRDKVVISPLSWLPGPFVFRQEIIWSRPGGMTHNSRMFLHSDERIYWLFKRPDFYFDDSTEVVSLSTVWRFNPEVSSDHPVAFPLELPSRCIRACSRRGDFVMDPYCGSGTTIVACERLGRRGLGLEIEPRFVAVALERLSGMGLEPKLVDQMRV